jgi:hypothetical protein
MAPRQAADGAWRHFTIMKVDVDEASGCPL